MVGGGGAVREVWPGDHQIPDREVVSARFVTLTIAGSQAGFDTDPRRVVAVEVSRIVTVRPTGTGARLVVCGYHSKERSVSIADPLQDNPLHGTKYYRVGLYRFIGAVYLGVATYDANFLVIRPKRQREAR